MSYDFLTHVEDPELRHEIRSVLNSLATLSEVGAPAIDRKAPSSDTPLGPPGFQNLAATDCPPEDRSTFEHFLFRFREQAPKGSQLKMSFILFEANKQLQLRTIPPSGEDRDSRIALHVARPDEGAFIRRVLDLYEGAHAYMVAVDLEVSRGWVERVREQGGYEPIMGIKRPEWKRMTQEERIALIAEAKKERLTQAETSKKYGIPRSTIANYWTEKVAA